MEVFTERSFKLIKAKGRSLQINSAQRAYMLAGWKSLPRNRDRRPQMRSRRISLAAVAIGIAIVQFVLPVPALAGINHGRVPQWRVEINQIGVGNSNIAPEFKIAIYENLVTELTKAKQFSAVLRSGDSSATAVSNLLILKTTVASFTLGSETKRA